MSVYKGWLLYRKRLLIKLDAQLQENTMNIEHKTEDLFKLVFINI